MHLELSLEIFTPLKYFFEKINLYTSDGLDKVVLPAFKYPSDCVELFPTLCYYAARHSRMDIIDQVLYKRNEYYDGMVCELEYQTIAALCEVGTWKFIKQVDDKHMLDDWCMMVCAKTAGRIKLAKKIEIQMAFDRMWD